MINISQTSIPLSDQFQIYGWRVAIAATRLAGNIWREAEPIVRPALRFWWLPPMAVACGFAVGLILVSQ
jgi:hypothetical protein